MSFDTPIHVIVVELLDHGLTPTQIGDKLEMTRDEIKQAIDGKVPYHILKRFLTRRGNTLNRRNAPRPMSKAAYWEMAPEPKSTLTAFKRRVLSGEPMEEAIKPMPAREIPLTQVWRECPDPAVGLTGFLVRVRKGMTIKEALTKRNHMDQLPRIEGKALFRWYSDHKDPACCLEVFRRRVLDGMDPREAITTPAAYRGSRSYSRGQDNVLQMVHDAWVKSGKQINYKRVLARVRNGEDIETAVLPMKRGEAA